MNFNAIFRQRQKNLTSTTSGWSFQRHRTLTDHYAAEPSPNLKEKAPRKLPVIAIVQYATRNWKYSYHNGKYGRVAGSERVFVERVEAIEQGMSFVPHDAGLECVATAAVLFKHCRVGVQPRVCKQTAKRPTYTTGKWFLLKATWSRLTVLALVTSCRLTVSFISSLNLLTVVCHLLITFVIKISRTECLFYKYN